jgi:hypothetical protein
MCDDGYFGDRIDGSFAGTPEQMGAVFVSNRALTTESLGAVSPILTMQQWQFTPPLDANTSLVGIEIVVRRQHPNNSIVASRSARHFENSFA